MELVEPVGHQPIKQLVLQTTTADCLSLTRYASAAICADNPGLSSDSASLKVMMGADVQDPATAIGSSVSGCVFL